MGAPAEASCLGNAREGTAGTWVRRAGGHATRLPTLVATDAAFAKPREWRATLGELVLKAPGSPECRR